MAREEIIRMAVGGRTAGERAVRGLSSFLPEDASRTELEFLAEVVEAAIEAGANTVNIPDTGGVCGPR